MHTGSITLSFDFHWNTGTWVARWFWFTYMRIWVFLFRDLPHHVEDLWHHRSPSSEGVSQIPEKWSREMFWSWWPDFFFQISLWHGDIDTSSDGREFENLKILSQCPITWNIDFSMSEWDLKIQNIRSSTSKHFLRPFYRELANSFWARRTVVPKVLDVVGGN